MDHQELLSCSHDRVVREAIHQASIELMQKRAEEKQEKKQSIEKRFENIEERLIKLESKQ
jgi:hypothetical protein